MSSVIKAESPLIQTLASSASITERELQGFINLRGEIGKGNTGFCKAVKKVTNLKPHPKANTLQRSGEYVLYWLGPDEYLLVTEEEKQGSTMAALEAALDGVFSSVTDVSSGYCQLDIVGEYAHQLLAKGCPLDLDAEKFKEGECAQTIVAQAGVLLSPLQRIDGFELIVRRSYADYLQRWLSQMNNGY